MKKFINIITITLFILTISIITNNKSVAQVPTVEKEFKIVNTYINNSNSNIIEFNDNSYVVINKDKNIYEFYAVECGDYEIKAEDLEQLTNIIKTYMLNKYDFLESEVNKCNIFKNDIFSISRRKGK